MDPEPPISSEAQAALDDVPCGLVRTREDGVILRANRTFCEWLGYTEADLLGRRLCDLLTMGGRIFHQTHWMPLIDMQGSVSELKLDWLRADGRPIPMVLNARRHAPAGQVVDDVALFIARDRDKYEREILQSRKRLEAVLAESKSLQEAAHDRALLAEQMMGIVSHDLRNSLQTVQMGALVLSRGQLSSNQLALLGRISRATDRAHRLIADLLDFTTARLGRGIAIQPKAVAPHAAIAEMVEELRDAFPGRELLHVAGGDCECVLDTDRLAQVVGNLVANAMAYGDPSSPVTVHSQCTPDGIEVAVHNGGKPIAPDLQARLFEPLVRGTQEGTARRNVGLGLFIVQEIAKAHGGQVRVTSTAEAGTTFTVAFPSRPPATEPAGSGPRGGAGEGLPTA